MDERQFDSASREVDEALALATGLSSDAERLLTPYSGNDEAFYRAQRAQNMLSLAYYGTVFPAFAALLVGATGFGLAFSGGGGLMLEYSQIGSRALAALAYFASVGLVYCFWRALPKEFRGRKSPAFVVLLLLVPFFNAIWYFPAICGGARRGLDALESLERNRLRMKSPIEPAYVAWGCWCVAALLTAGVFLNPDVRADVSWDDFWSAIVGTQPYFVTSISLAWVAFVNLVAFGLVFIGAGVYALALGRMREIAERILALRLEASADPFATEESRAKDRAELDRIMDSPTSR